MFEYPQLSTSFVTSSSRSVAYDSVGYTLILLNNLGQMLVIKLVWMPPLDMLRLHPILIRLDAIIFRSIPLGKRICMDVNFLISSALFGRLTIGQGVSHRNTANALRYFHCVSGGWYSSFSDNVGFRLFAACCVPVLCLLGLLLHLFAIHTRGTSQCDWGPHWKKGVVRGPGVITVLRRFPSHFSCCSLDYFLITFLFLCTFYFWVTGGDTSITQFKPCTIQK